MCRMNTIVHEVTHHMINFTQEPLHKNYIKHVLLYMYSRPVAVATVCYTSVYRQWPTVLGITTSLELS